MNLVDYSDARPSMAQLKAAGVHGVIRYLSQDPAKAISVAEASKLHAADIPYALVYEDQAEDFTSPARGLAKAQIAATQLAALERAQLWAPDRPVYCAVDGSLDPSLYLPTWLSISAFATALKRPSGVYGPRPFLLFAEEKGCRYLFESGASSWNTGPEPKCKTLQQLVTVPPGAGPLSGVDWDIACAADWGQFPFAPPSTEEDMILTHLHDGQPVVVFAAESGYRPLGPELQAWLLSAGYAFKPPLPQNPPLKNLGPFSAK